LDSTERRNVVNKKLEMKIKNKEIKYKVDYGWKFCINKYISYLTLLHRRVCLLEVQHSKFLGKMLLKKFVIVCLYHGIENVSEKQKSFSSEKRDNTRVL
jgi:hypothetical protein